MPSTLAIVFITLASLFIFLAIGIFAWKAWQYVQQHLYLNHLESIPLTDFTTHDSNITAHPQDPFACFIPIYPEPAHVQSQSYHNSTSMSPSL
jgi:hypothetical protein